MKSQVLANFDVTWLPVTALIIFLVVFFGVLGKMASGCSRSNEKGQTQGLRKG